MYDNFFIYKLQIVYINRCHFMKGLKTMTDFTNPIYPRTVSDMVSVPDPTSQQEGAITTLTNRLTNTPILVDGKVPASQLPDSEKGISFWEASTEYVVGDVCIYNNLIYRCTTAHTSDVSFDYTKWESLANNVLPWTPSTVYVSGFSFVSYNGILYLCTTSHTSETSFDDTKWQVISGLSSIYSQHIAGSDSTISSITLNGAPCTDPNNMFVMVEHTVVPPTLYSLGSGGTVLTFNTPVDAGLDVDLRWFGADNVIGSRNGGVQILDIGQAFYVDESLNLRRWLNGQLVAYSISPAFIDALKKLQILVPSLFTTEENWQSEKTLSKLGQAGKFVLDDENQTVRLPVVINSQGLLGLSGIGNLVNESLPIPHHYHTFNIGNGENSAINPDLGVPAGGTFNTNDAEGFSAPYSEGAPVQQEAIQYPYYIQIATGVEERLPAIREYKVNTPFFFGWSRYFDNAPYNASLLASKGQYNASITYPDLWTQLTGVELNESINVGDTIEIGGKTYIKRGLPVVLSTDTITDRDFVVNQNDQTFRLPLLNGEEDLRGNVTESVSGVISGSGTTSFTATKNGWLSGKAYKTQDASLIVFVNNDSEICRTHADAGSAATIEAFVKAGQTISVQFLNLFFLNFTPAVGNGTLYYYVGDVVQDASLINAGTILGQLSDKISRTTASDKELVVSWGMPDYSAGVALPMDGTVTTISSNGWVEVGLEAYNNTQAIWNLNGVDLKVAQSNNNSYSTYGLVIYPVTKGDVVKIVSKLAGTSTPIFTFYPCKGV